MKTVDGTVRTTIRRTTADDVRDTLAVTSVAVEVDRGEMVRAGLHHDGTRVVIIRGADLGNLQREAWQDGYDAALADLQEAAQRRRQGGQ